jgi:hypothetical protein
MLQDMGAVNHIESVIGKWKWFPEIVVDDSIPVFSVDVVPFVREYVAASRIEVSVSVLRSADIHFGMKIRSLIGMISFLREVPLCPGVFPWLQEIPDEDFYYYSMHRRWMPVNP